MHNLITIIAKDFIVIPLLIALVVWLRLDRHHKKEFIVLAAGSAVITLALAVIGSKLFNDPRPFVVGHFTPYFAHGHDNGFPSDHTLLGSLLAFLVYKYDRKLGGLALIFALAIGLARVLSGVHHTVDIIGSVVFAALGVSLTAALIHRMSKQGIRHQLPDAKQQ